MGELVRASLPFMLPALLPAVALMLAGSVGQRVRRLWAALFGLAAAGLVADVVVIDHRDANTVEVVNVFRRAGEAAPHRWVVDTVTAPAWQWHVVLAAFLAALALGLWLRRGPAVVPRWPIAAALGTSLYYLTLRLLLEKTAAPAPIAWAFGVTPASLVVLPLFGWLCGRAGHGMLRFVARLAGLVVLQRLMIVAMAYFVTTRGLGTHLDTHCVREVALPGMASRTLDDPLEAWVWTMVIPQLTYFVVIGTVLGGVLGALPWWVARRRALRRGACATELGALR